MAHLKGFISRSVNSTANLESVSSSTLSTTGCTTVGIGGEGENSVSVQNSAAISGEIDKHLSQIKCKRAFQDEESLNGQAASVFSSQELSQLIALICGVEKMELRSEIRQSLKEMEGLFNELIKETNVSNGIKIKEGINELFHNPEHIVFQAPLSNEPAEWTKLVLSVLMDIQRKVVLKEEVRKDIQEFQMKRREVAKDIGLEKKRLAELQALKKEKDDKMHTDNLRRLTIALESDKAEASKIEEDLSKHGTVITNSEMEDFASRFMELKSLHRNLKEELQQVSADGLLPPDRFEATAMLSSRKSYLETLLQQISNP